MQLIILGQLIEKPSHGYAIKQTLDCIIGTRKKISWGSLYPILGKLEKEALIKKVRSRQKSGPAQKIYSITPKGRNRFLELMVEFDYIRGDTRAIFRYKLLFFDKIGKSLRIKIITDYQDYCEEGAKIIEHHLDEIKKQKFPPNKLPYILEDLKHSLESYRIEKEWAQKLLKKEQL